MEISKLRLAVIFSRFKNKSIKNNVMTGEEKQIDFFLDDANQDGEYYILGNTKKVELWKKSDKRVDDIICVAVNNNDGLDKLVNKFSEHREKLLRKQSAKLSR